MKRNSRLRKNMIRKYNIKALQYDFMGYSFNNISNLAYHHLIIPFKLCRFYGIGKGKILCNGVLLNKDTSHTYLHVVEAFDEERFLAITSELLDEVIKGKISLENIRIILDILASFEREYANVKSANGEYIIKEQFTCNRIHKII